MIQKIFRTILFSMHNLLRALGIRLIAKDELQPRFFSNKLLKKYASFFHGKVINVSGWNDTDKEGKRYKDYFSNCSDYIISNAATKQKGIGSMAGSDDQEIEINLNFPLPEKLQGQFDVVFNHTTLEHVIEVEQAFKNLCDLSRDAVILVVPAIQQIHTEESFGDYWRLTTIGIAKMFIKYGLDPIVIAANDQPFVPIYCFAIAVRDYSKYSGKIEKKLDFEMGKYLYGSSLKPANIPNLLKE